MITDACVPLSRLSELITVTRAALDASWLPAPIIAHAGMLFKHFNSLHPISALEYVHSQPSWLNLPTPLLTSPLLTSPHLSSHCPDTPGDGNFHVLLMLRPDVSGDVREAHRLAGDIATAAISMGGTCTGEHGE
jgi:FAD/FMN-containing dehydrogenase